MLRLFQLTLLAGALLAMPLIHPAASSAAPAPASIANIIDATGTACDPTGHCARLHVVIQVQDALRIRSFASVTCYSGSGDFPCAGFQGSTWLNCTATGGIDCSVDGPIRQCGARYGAPACPLAFVLVTPWKTLPTQSNRYSGAASGLYTTGAPGGGTRGVSAVTPDIGF